MFCVVCLIFLRRIVFRHEFEPKVFRASRRIGAILQF